VNLNVKQVGVVAFCAVLACCIYAFSKKAPAEVLKQKQGAEAKVDTSFSFLDFKTSAKNALDSSSLALLVKWESKDDTASLRNLAGFWASLNNAGLSACYLEQLSGLIPNGENWFNTGYRFLVASRATEKQGEKMYFCRKAINAFSSALKVDSSNLEAKANLGVCYVEGSQILGTQPMQGVGLLKEVLEKDPKNITALINLGYFSIQSGQYDKALERFNLVVAIKPDYLDAYIYLADTYQRMGKKDEAIKVLETLKSKNKNPEVEANVNEFIRELKAS
jgi:tetratricopeptide (TPR) repeat protein